MRSNLSGMWTRHILVTLAACILFAISTTSATAASLWTTSALGVLFGVGFYDVAIGATLATLMVLVIFRFVDLRMPGRSGLDLIRQLKSIDPETKIVVLTAYGLASSTYLADGSLSQSAAGSSVPARRDSTPVGVDTADRAAVSIRSMMAFSSHP